MLTKETVFTALLVFVPLSIAAHFLGWGALTIFITSGIAIIPLAAWMGTATEELSASLGSAIGGLLNATFGNATELIIALIALRAGLVDVVQATITGSIIGNLLLVLGFSMLLGGLRYPEQSFQQTAARVNASSLNLAVIAILLPTAASLLSGGIPEPTMQRLSSAVAIVLILVYGLMLLFSMRTHTHLYNLELAAINATLYDEGNEPIDTIDTIEATPAAPHESRGRWFWVGLLLGITLLVAIESELLVGALETATAQLRLTPLFTGVVLLPIIGNAAEHATAVTVAMKNKMELSMAVAVGSSLQIALFVAPVLVLAGLVLGQPMDLSFNPFELVAVGVAVLLSNSTISDGKSNWLEGALLLATYLVLAITFYFYPV
ncbi:calcium/proton exchanger [Leptolyngbya sp. NIES-2104]|uniref:calcium/proton exchanger n=1 Tax=Leptolyngbya sp. NIES-2104 TaxID=1552121 RepID=UPI0006ECCE07|nr:calcium/proton exchanger [Leptolyngbya sp. NIES-2104]GAP99539.1 calcium/proton exchanger [Leptolyngbya sp. NIES-2104]